MRTLPIPTGRLLIVQGEMIPPGSTLELVPDNTYTMWNSDKMDVIDIPGSWSLLGKASELTYEQKGLICKRENGYFEDYCGDGYLFTSVTLSYVSFLTFHGIKPEDYLLIENKI